MKKRISLVDDDGPIRAQLIELINSTEHLEISGEFATTAAALSTLPLLKPDVVLMDINIPKLNGVECVRQLKPLLPQTQFLMLTVYEDADHIFAALEAGATGYLLKSTRRDELLEAVEQIMKGGSPMSGSIARKVVQSFARVPPSQPNVEALSPREKAVLDLLIKGYLCKEIAESMGVTTSTVNTFIRRIYEKLQVHSRSQAVAKFLNKI